MRDCVSYHQHHVFGCKHHTLDCTKWSLINYIVFTFIAKQRCLVVPLHQWMDNTPTIPIPADGVQVHSALECHKTRWPDHVHVTVKHDVVLELITWAVSLDVVDVHRGLVRSFSSDTGLNDALVHRFVCRRLCIWTAYILLLLIWTVTVSRGYLTIASYRALSVNSVDTTVCILLHASVLICVRLCVVLVVILDWMMR